MTREKKNGSVRIEILAREDCPHLGMALVVVERDVDPEPNLHADFSVEDRIYRTPRGPSGWPEPEWIRAALLRAVAQTNSNGTH